MCRDWLFLLSACLNNSLWKYNSSHIEGKRDHSIPKAAVLCSYAPFMINELFINLSRITYRTT